MERIRRSCLLTTSRCLALMGVALLTPVLSLAHGGFTTPRVYPFGEYTDRVATADLDSDGYRDLVVIDPHSTRLAVLYGLGDGSFDSAIELVPAYSPDSIQLADVNGDSELDIVVAARRGVISVFVHESGRRFTRIRNTVIGIVDFGFAAADFNGDGYADLFAVANGGARLLLGRGDGTFEPQPVVAPRLLIWSAAVADFDGDGCLDVAAVDGNNPGVHMFFGDCRGGLGREVVLPGPAFARVAIADLNDDGSPDVVARAAEGIFVFANRGGGVFGDALVSSEEGSLAFEIAVADMDGDGSNDIVEADYNRSVISLYRVVGDGKLTRYLRIRLPGRPEGFAVADLNGGGRPDIAVTVPDVKAVLVLLNGAPDVTGTRFATRGGVSTALVLTGKNFDRDARVFVGGSTEPWPNVKVQHTRIRLGGGTALDTAFPVGVPVPVRIANVDGEQSSYLVTR